MARVRQYPEETPISDLKRRLAIIEGIIHDEAHTVVSHSDTGATGAELNTLTDGSDADALHAHSPNWQTWSPTLANITVGNGTETARYVQLGDLVVARWYLVLGSTSSIGTNPTVSLPVTADTSYSSRHSIGRVVMFESGGLTFHGFVRRSNTTIADAFIFNASLTYLTQSSITATVPFTWGQSDIMFWEFTYEAA